MHIYRLLIMLSHVMGWAPIWVVGGSGSWAKPLRTVIMGP